MNTYRVVPFFCFRLFCILQLISCFKIIYLVQIERLLRRSSILIVNIFSLYIIVKQKQTKNDKDLNFDNIFLLFHSVLFTLVQREYCWFSQFCLLWFSVSTVGLISSVYSGSAWILLVYLVLFTLVQREYCWFTQSCLLLFIVNTVGLLSPVYSGSAWLLLVYSVLFTLVQREYC